MKKIAILTIALTAASLVSCGHDNNQPAASAPAASTTTAAAEAAVTSTSDTTASTESTEITSTAADDSTVTTAAATDTAKVPADSDTDFSGLAGYWYVNGDAADAFIHFAPDGSFQSYFPNGTQENSGFVRREFNSDINNYYYAMYLDSGEPYFTFSDDGLKDKTDIYMGYEASPHYVKIYGEGGLGDDGRAPGEEFCGRWECERAHISITSDADGQFTAVVTWSDSVSSYVEWVYPLTYSDGKLVCEGKGKKSFVTASAPAAEPSYESIYADGSAEFVLKDGGINWIDKSENSADGMLFKLTLE